MKTNGLFLAKITNNLHFSKFLTTFMTITTAYPHELIGCVKDILTAAVC